MKMKQIACLVVAVLGLATSTANAQEVLLGPGDRLNVRVAGRPDISGEYELRSSGNLRLPLVGDVKAAGQSIEGLESRLAALLADGVERNPSVLVSVLRWRPVYVIGDVSNPGAVDFTPGLNVIKAVSMAGGFGSKGAEETGYKLQNIRAHELKRTSEIERETLLGRLARLVTERDGGDAIQFPEVLSARGDDPDIARIMQTESELFSARRDQHAAHLESLRRRAATYEKQLAALSKQRESLTKSLEILSADVKRGASLVERGLQVASVQSQTERSRLDTVGELARNSSLVAEAESALEATQQAIRELPFMRLSEVLRDLSQTRLALRINAENVVAAAETVAETESPRISMNGGTYARRNAQMVVIRNGDVAKADDLTPLSAGDVVEVQVVSPEQTD